MAERPLVEGALARAAFLGDKLLSVFSGLLAAFLVMYGAYVIYDSLYTQSRAFSSEWDLLQYRPQIIDDDGVPLAGSAAFAALNEDYRAWLTLYGTNIDYPVVQGADDLYYSSHDVFKKSSLTGAIYLACANAADFGDAYSLVYGHHMDNGAMFGGLDRYRDETYFNAHRGGILVLPGTVYDLEVFALVETDAYNRSIYRAGSRYLDEVFEYVDGHALQADARSYATARTLGRQILALSTCASAATNGRLVLLAAMTPREFAPLQALDPEGPEATEEPAAPEGPDGPARLDEPSDRDETADWSSPSSPTGPSGFEPAVPPAGPAARPAGTGTVGTESPDEEPPATNTATDAPGADEDPGRQGDEADEAQLERLDSETLADDQTPLARLANRFQPTGGSYGTRAWALVNLLCVIATVYLLAPLLHVRAKYARPKAMRDVNGQKEGLREASSLEGHEVFERELIVRTAIQMRGGRWCAPSEDRRSGDDVDPDEFKSAVEALYYRQAGFSRRLRACVVLEAVLSAASVASFVLTENVRLPMTLIDRWTPLMILLLLACWIVDVRLARYRGQGGAGEAPSALVAPYGPSTSTSAAGNPV